MTSDTDTPPSAETPLLIEQSRRAVMISYYALLGIYTLDSMWKLPGGNVTAIVFLWLLKVLPLLIFLPGLRRRHLRTYAWLSFVMLLYFIVGVQTAFMEETRVYGVVITMLMSVLFSALVVHIRAFRGFYKTSL